MPSNTLAPADSLEQLTQGIMTIAPQLLDDARRNESKLLQPQIDIVLNSLAILQNGVAENKSFESKPFEHNGAFYQVKVTPWHLEDSSVTSYIISINQLNTHYSSDNGGFEFTRNPRTRDILIDGSTMVNLYYSPQKNNWDISGLNLPPDVSISSQFEIFSDIMSVATGHISNENISREGNSSESTIKADNIQSSLRIPITSPNSPWRIDNEENYQKIQNSRNHPSTTRNPPSGGS